jgi:phosphoglycolate phosphatase-like HAD superfamily hydrolase
MAAAAQSGATPARTLLVGDSVIDYETAARAASRCCLATYGFGYLMFPKDRLTGEEWMAPAPDHLPAIFDRFTAAAG